MSTVVKKKFWISVKFKKSVITGLWNDYTD